MKKLNAWLLLSMLAVAVACKDDDSPANSITSDEAAAIISSSLASNTSGVNLVSGKTADVSKDMLEDNEGGRVAGCGISQTLGFSGESAAGAEVTYNYDFSYEFKLNCNEESKPTEVTVALTYNGAFDAPKLAGQHNGLAELDVTDMEEAANSLLMNGLFKRSGSFENKEAQQSISCSIEIKLEEVVINKTTEQITSGTASFDISGNVPDKGAFKYTGQVTFQGTDLAEINVGGSRYASNMKNGSVTKK